MSSVEFYAKFSDSSNQKAEYSKEQNDAEQEAQNLINQENKNRIELIPIYLEIFTGIGIIWLVFIAAIICLNGEANLQGKTYVKENTTIELIRIIYFAPLTIGASYLFGAYRRK